MASIARRSPPACVKRSTSTLTVQFCGCNTIRRRQPCENRTGRVPVLIKSTPFASERAPESSSTAGHAPAKRRRVARYRVDPNEVRPQLPWPPRPPRAPYPPFALPSPPLAFFRPRNAPVYGHRPRPGRRPNCNSVRKFPLSRDSTLHTPPAKRAYFVPFCPERQVFV